MKTSVNRNKTKAILSGACFAVVALIWLFYNYYIFTNITFIISALVGIGYILLSVGMFACRPGIGVAGCAAVSLNSLIYFLTVKGLSGVYILQTGLYAAAYVILILALTVKKNNNVFGILSSALILAYLFLIILQYGQIGVLAFIEYAAAAVGAVLAGFAVIQMRTQPTDEQELQAQELQAQEPEESVPTGKYAPIGAWTYFGYTLLFSIPLVGLIFLLVYAFSDANINRRNFARSYFCSLLFALIVVLILALCGVNFSNLRY